VGPDRDAEEVLVLEVGLTFHLKVTSTEGFGQSLDLNSQDDEIIQRKSSTSWGSSILGGKALDECGREPVPHVLKCLDQLVVTQKSSPVPVKTLKHSLLLLDEGEQGTELSQVKCPHLSVIKHPDQFPAGLPTELGPITISQGLAKLTSIYLATAISVHTVEPGSNLRVNSRCPRISTWVSL